MVNFQYKEHYTIQDFRRIMELLREPDGCPWDRVQTHESIRRNMLEEAYAVFPQHGYSPYYLYRQKNMAGNFENVGYARAGKECLYNILIMEEVQSILSVGAGTPTKLVHSSGLIERVENVKDIKSYLERIDEMIERKHKKLEGYHG